MAKTVLYKGFMKALDNSVKESLVMLKDEIEDAEILPFQTGNLTDSAYVDKVNDCQYQLVYDPFDSVNNEYYAVDMYYISTLHPEWHLHQSNPPDPVKHNNKTHKKFNKNAKERWLDDYIQNPNIVADMLIKCLKNTGYIS